MCVAILSISALVIKDSQKALFCYAWEREIETQSKATSEGGGAGLNDMFVWLKRERGGKKIKRGKKADDFGFLSACQVPLDKL